MCLIVLFWLFSTSKLLHRCFLLVMNTPVEVISKLYIGSVKSASVSRPRFDGIVSVMLSPPCKLNSEDCQRLIVPVNDTVEDDLKAHFTMTSDFINNVISVGGSVLVHCKMGVSRSCTIILAYLMKYEHISLNEAYQLVKSKRRTVRPNYGFWKQLISYESEIFHGKTSVSFVTLPSGPSVPSVYEDEFRNMVLTE